MTDAAATPAVAEPTTIEEATQLLEEVASLEGQLAKIEEDRASLISDSNAACDKLANPLIDRRNALQAVLEPWWGKSSAALTGGKRKSIELGGCVIGSKAGSASLSIDGDEKALITALGKRAWAAGLLRVTPALDKAATLKALAGDHGRKLKALGLGRKEGVETFFVRRAEQAGTRTSAS